MEYNKKKHLITKFGKHLLVEFSGCDFSILNDSEIIRQALIDAVRAGGATLIDVCVHQFSPNGITGAATLSESHICIHTWPEEKYAAIDIFMCGKGSPEKALKSLEAVLFPTAIEVREIIRGIHIKR